jgi:hypothetical protein
LVRPNSLEFGAYREQTISLFSPSSVQVVGPVFRFGSFQKIITKEIQDNFVFVLIIQNLNRNHVG